MTNLLLALFLSACVFALGCRQGAGGESPPPASVNAPPILCWEFASEDGIDLGQEAVIDASCSADPEGEPLYFQWIPRTEPSGTQTRYAGTETELLSFVAEKIGLYEFTLFVTDGENYVRSSDIGLEVVANDGTVVYPVTVRVNEGRRLEVQVGEVLPIVVEVCFSDDVCRQMEEEPGSWTYTLELDDNFPTGYAEVREDILLNQWVVEGIAEHDWYRIIIVIYNREPLPGHMDTLYTSSRVLHILPNEQDTRTSTSRISNASDCRDYCNGTPCGNSCDPDESLEELVEIDDNGGSIDLQVRWREDDPNADPQRVMDAAKRFVSRLISEGMWSAPPGGRLEFHLVPDLDNKGTTFEEFIALRSDLEDLEWVTAHEAFHALTHFRLRPESQPFSKWLEESSASYLASYALGNFDHMTAQETFDSLLPEIFGAPYRRSLYSPELSPYMRRDFLHLLTTGPRNSTEDSDFLFPLLWDSWTAENGMPAVSANRRLNSLLNRHNGFSLTPYQIDFQRHWYSVANADALSFDPPAYLDYAANAVFSYFSGEFDPNLHAVNFAPMDEVTLNAPVEAWLAKSRFDMRLESHSFALHHIESSKWLDSENKEICLLGACGGLWGISLVGSVEDRPTGEHPVSHVVECGQPTCFDLEPHHNDESLTVVVVNLDGNIPHYRFQGVQRSGTLYLGEASPYLLRIR